MQRLDRFLGNLFAVMLLVFSMQATAATEVAGRDFDHSATGFPLTGGHAMAACETCHVAGVFKGTPKNCDGCHALGRRVVATPKSTSHIVTDAPCETCHFNTFTFYGAKYNHGTAIPGQCVTCHNGRITTGRPANHNAGLMLTGSCDNCHRSYAFLPASWNHTGVAMGAHTCNQAGCHLPGANTNRYTYATAVSPVNHSSYSDTNSKSCDVCHISFVSWNAVMHEPYGGACNACHNGSAAQGTPAGHVSVGTNDCNQCHTSTASWLGALGGMPSNHIPFNAGVTCTNCHVGATSARVNVNLLHANSSSYTCANCHINPTSPGNYLGNNQNTKSSHSGSSGNNCTGCHTHSSAGSYVSWGGG